MTVAHLEIVARWAPELLERICRVLRHRGATLEHLTFTIIGDARGFANAAGPDAAGGGNPARHKKFISTCGLDSGAIPICWCANSTVYPIQTSLADGMRRASDTRRGHRERSGWPRNAAPETAGAGCCGWTGAA